MPVLHSAELLRDHVPRLCECPFEPLAQWQRAPLTSCTPHPTLNQAWHNDGWHLPMVAALAFSTYLKLASWNEDHMASHNHKG